MHQPTIELFGMENARKHRGETVENIMIISLKYNTFKR